MSVYTTSGRPRRRGFKLWLMLSVVVGVALQIWTGSHNPALLVVPIGTVFAAYLIPVIVRARRERRASGAPRPRVIYPLAFRIAGIAFLLWSVLMYVLFFSKTGGAIAAKHRGLENALEGAIALAALAVAQWQRSIVRRQLGSDWNGQTSGVVRSR